MFIRIPSTEKDAHDYACATSGLTCKVIESNRHNVLLKIMNNGKNPSGVIAYRLREIVEQKIRYDFEEKQYKAMLNEMDLIQEPKNNVLITVENIEDLPR